MNGWGEKAAGRFESTHTDRRPQVGAGGAGTVSGTGAEFQAQVFAFQDSWARDRKEPAGGRRGGGGWWSASLSG